MKRNTILDLSCAFVDETNGLNSLYKIVYKKIPFVLDVLSKEVSVTSVSMSENETVNIEFTCTSHFEQKLRTAFFDAVKNNKVFDISINGIDIIPFSITTITNSILPNGFKPVENTKRFRFM